jgi:hypothetical protein
MSRKLIELVDEQPLPNLISIRAIKPDEVLFVDSKNTQDVTKHLRRLLREEIKIHVLTVRDPFDPTDIFWKLKEKTDSLGWTGGNIIYNISGGRRTKAFAAYELAKLHHSILADMERVRSQYRLRLYRFEDGRPMLKQDIKLSGLITIADYLNAHLPGFDVDGFSQDDRGRIDDGGKFEQAVHRVLEPHVDEIISGVRPAGVAHQIEIDLIVRHGNAIGLIEAKTGVNKAGIDQLDTAGNPLYLGRYATKFLITGRYLPRAHKVLANAQNIHVIELPGYHVRHGIPKSERDRLIQAIKNAL